MDQKVVGKQIKAEGLRKKCITAKKNPQRIKYWSQQRPKKKVLIGKRKRGYEVLLKDYFCGDTVETQAGNITWEEKESFDM